jgi:hypothetical protein
MENRFLSTQDELLASTTHLKEKKKKKKTWLATKEL